MTKLKVSTLRGDKARKIISCLKRYPEGTTPKVIALNTRINVNTVKSILPKIPLVHKTMRGMYKVLNRGDGTLASTGTPLTCWNFHNCILSCSTGLILPSLHTSTISLTLFQLKIQITKKGAVSLRLSSDYPLNVSSIELLGLLLSVWLQHEFNVLIDQSKLILSTIEFNKDYSNLRLDGLRCLTIDSLIEQFKVYQKKRGMRIEHKTKVPFTAENVIQMLSSNPYSLETEVRLLKQSSELKRMQSAMTQTNELLKRLLEVRT